VGPLGGIGTQDAPPILGMIAASHLAWFPEVQIGYYPVPPAVNVYDDDYFAKYVAYAQTELGQRLTLARMALVNRHHGNGPLVDVGIGCGSFVDARENTHGYDINVRGIEWLNRRDLWWNPYTRRCRAISLWDVIEHIADFPALLARVDEFVFVSLPIFTGPDDVLLSRHYRRDEHVWYFTRDGFVRVMSGLGWQLLEENNDETRLGRDSIGSFAFRRRECSPC
jgi:Methyltransferase domain